MKEGRYYSLCRFLWFEPRVSSGVKPDILLNMYLLMTCGILFLVWECAAPGTRSIGEGFNAITQILHTLGELLRGIPNFGFWSLLQACGGWVMWECMMREWMECANSSETNCGHFIWVVSSDTTTNNVSVVKRQNTDAKTCIFQTKQSGVRLRMCM